MEQGCEEIIIRSRKTYWRMRKKYFSKEDFEFSFKNIEFEMPMENLLN